MKEVVSQFSHLVRSARFDTDQAAHQKLVERCEVLFMNGSRLVAHEPSTGIKFKYSYQWMDGMNQPIYRWDNATHFPQFETYPYHRHSGVGEVAEPFPRITLVEVFRFIDTQLTSER